MQLLFKRRVASSFEYCLRKVSRAWMHRNKLIVESRRLLTSKSDKPFRPVLNSLSVYCAMYVGVKIYEFMNS